MIPATNFFTSFSLLKSPHWTDVDRGVLGGVELIAEAETLEPRVVAAGLRRTPIVVGRKNILPQHPARTDCAGTGCLAGVASIFTHLVQFILGR